MNTLSHPHPLAQPAPTGKTSRWLLYETLIILALTIIPSLIWPQTKGVLSFLPVVYLLTERYLRRRPWADLGLQRQGFRQALAANWLLIVFVGVVIQFAVLMIGRVFWPALLEHIEARVPLFDRTPAALFFVLLAISTFLEELIYRGLFQARLSWFARPLLANLLVSLLFASMHWSAGNPAVIAMDVALVALDSVIYGLIFTRGRNLYAAWLAHFLADVVAIALLLAP